MQRHYLKRLVSPPRPLPLVLPVAPPPLRVRPAGEDGGLTRYHRRGGAAGVGQLKGEACLQRQAQKQEQSPIHCPFLAQTLSLFAREILLLLLLLGGIFFAEERERKELRVRPPSPLLSSFTFTTSAELIGIRNNCQR